MTYTLSPKLMHRARQTPKPRQWFKNVRLYTGQPTPDSRSWENRISYGGYWVAEPGDDSNDGSYDSPLKTLQEAHRRIYA